MTTTAITRPAAARIAGVGYLAIFVLAIGANFFVRNPLVVAGDPAATMANIAGNETAFRFGIGAFAAIAVIDILIAWALHVLLRPTGERRSLLAAWLRLGYSVVFAVAVGFMYLALKTAIGSQRFAGLGDGGRAAVTALAMDGFDIVWLIGLVVFGLHLIVVGRIITVSSIGPRVLGILLAVAGGAYIVDTFAHILYADYAAVADIMLMIVMVPSMIAEMWFALWLLVRAPRHARTQADDTAPVAVDA